MNVKKVFLGGTCAESTWRDQLIPQLSINYFNPVVPDWNPECQAEEIKQREECDFCLYVISPEMEGVYSIAEVVDDSNKRPEKTVFCIVGAPYDAPGRRQDGISFSKTQFSVGQFKSLSSVERLVESNGAKVCYSLREVAAYLNEGCE